MNHNNHKEMEVKTTLIKRCRGKQQIDFKQFYIF